MAASRRFIVIGLDPTGLPNGITKAQLLQMTEAAGPDSDIGFLFIGGVAPVIATYPETARFIWLNISNGEIRYYTGASWQLCTATVNIAAGSVTISKLSVSGGAAYNLIRVNAGATAFEFVTPVNAIADGTLPIAKLDGAVGNNVLASIADVQSWVSYATLAAAIQPLLPDIAITQITKGSPNQLLYTDATPEVAWGGVNTALADNSLDHKKINYSTYELSIVAGVVNMNASLATSFYLNLTANVTDFNVLGIVNGMTVNLAIRQDAAWTVTFDASIIWSGATPPVITATAGRVGILSFSKINNVIYGAYIQDYH